MASSSYLSPLKVVMALAYLGAAALVWPAGALIPRGYERRYRKQLGERVEKPTLGAGGARLARLVAWLVCVLALLSPVGVVSVSSNAEENLFYRTSLLRLSLAVVAPRRITPPLVGLFYLGCVPAALSESAFPKERWPLWAAVLVLWTAMWLALVGVGKPLRADAGMAEGPGPRGARGRRQGPGQ